MDLTANSAVGLNRTGEGQRWLCHQYLDTLLEAFVLLIGTSAVSGLCSMHSSGKYGRQRFCILTKWDSKCMCQC